MTAYIFKRLGIGVLTLIAASVIVFAVFEILPGDPAQLMLGLNATPDAVHALHVQMGLDQPLVARYLTWAGGMLVGDFGRSYTYSTPVIDLIAERSVVSLPLALIALFLSTAIAVPVGIFSASRRGKRRRHRGHGRRPTRRRHPEFLVRPASDLRLRRLAAAGAGRRLSRLERRSVAGSQGRSSCRRWPWPCRKPRSWRG